MGGIGSAFKSALSQGGIVAEGIWACNCKVAEVIPRWGAAIVPFCKVLSLDLLYKNIPRYRWTVCVKTVTLSLLYFVVLKTI